MMLAAAGVLLPIASMFCVVGLVQDGGRWPRLWRCAVAAGVGSGLAALLWGAMLAAGLSSGVAVTLDAIIWTTVGAAALFTRVRRPAGRSVEMTPSRTVSTFLALALFLAVAAIAATAFYGQASVFPHGNWDAWAIWNLKARFLARGAADGAWREVFSPVIGWSHPDYPLLLPWLVARGWAYAGRETVAVPIAYSALFSVALVAILTVSVARLQGVTAGLLAGAFLLAAPAFVTYAPVQCADVPLAFFYLLTIALAAEAERSRSGGAWLLAGAAAGLAMWTKNEGAAFWLISAGALGTAALRGGTGRPLRGPALFLTVSLPLVAALIAFKTSIGLSNDVVNTTTAGMLWARLADTDRVVLVLSAIGRELWFGGAEWVGVLPVLGLYLLAQGWTRPIEAVVARAGVIVVLTLAVYTAVYLATPHDLAWHLRTSLDRVILQLLPTVIWLGCLLTRDAL
ncbi:MAG: glycosyltransferase family 39 protein [Vicinamibacterales bacterium]